MYKTTVRIPLITAATVAEITKLSPNLSTVVKIPLIDTEAEAVTHATRILTDSFGYSYEFIREVGEIQLDETANMWVGNFTVSGD